MHGFQATAYPDDACKFCLRLLKTKLGLLMAALIRFHSSSTSHTDFNVHSKAGFETMLLQQKCSLFDLLLVLVSKSDCALSWRLHTSADKLNLPTRQSLLRALILC